MPSLSFLTEWLQALLCAVEGVAYAVLRLGVVGINAIIAGLAGLIAAAVDLMPNMPTMPETPEVVSSVVAWVAWVLPVSTVIDILAFSFGAWLLWQGVVLVLRWAKATNE